MKNINAALQSFLADTQTQTLITQSVELNFAGGQFLDQPSDSYYLSIPFCESEEIANAPTLQVSIEINDDNANQINVWALADFYESGIVIKDGPDISSDIVFFANQDEVDSEDSLINQIVAQLSHTRFETGDKEKTQDAKFKMKNISTFVTFAIKLMKHTKEFNQARSQRAA